MITRGQLILTLAMTFSNVHVDDEGHRQAGDWVKLLRVDRRCIFAIENYVNQRLLRPIHDWAMEVLKRIPVNGTFQRT